MQIRRPITAEPLTASSPQGHPQAVVGRPEGYEVDRVAWPLVEVAHACGHRPGQGDGQYLLLRAGPREQPSGANRAESGSSWSSIYQKQEVASWCLTMQPPQEGRLSPPLPGPSWGSGIPTMPGDKAAPQQVLAMVTDQAQRTLSTHAGQPCPHSPPPLHLHPWPCCSPSCPGYHCHHYWGDLLGSSGPSQ